MFLPKYLTYEQDTMDQARRTNPMVEACDGHRFITIGSSRLGSPEYLFYDDDDSYEMTWKEGMEEIEDFDWQLKDDGPQEDKMQQDDESMRLSSQLHMSGDLDETRSVHADGSVHQQKAISVQTGILLSRYPNPGGMEVKLVEAQSVDSRHMDVFDPEVTSRVLVDESKLPANSSLRYSLFEQRQTESFSDARAPLIGLKEADDKNEHVDDSKTRGRSQETHRGKRHQSTTSQDELSLAVAAQEASQGSSRNSTFSPLATTSVESGRLPKMLRSNLLVTAERYLAITKPFSQENFHDVVRPIPQVPTYSSISPASSGAFNKIITSQNLYTDQNPGLSPVEESPKKSPGQFSLENVKDVIDGDGSANTEGRQLKKPVSHSEEAIQTSVIKCRSRSLSEAPKVILRTASNETANIPSVNLVEAGKPSTNTSPIHCRGSSEVIQGRNGNCIIDTPTTEEDRVKEDINVKMTKRVPTSRLNGIAYVGSQNTKPSQGVGSISSNIPGLGFFGLETSTENSGITSAESARRTETLFSLSKGSAKLRESNPTGYSIQQEHSCLENGASELQSIGATMDEVVTRGTRSEKLTGISEKNPILSPNLIATPFSVRRSHSLPDYSFNINAELEAIVEERNMIRRGHESRKNIITRLKMQDKYDNLPGTPSPAKSDAKNRRSALQSMIKERGLPLSSRDSSSRLAKRIEAHDRKTEVSASDDGNPNASTPIPYTPSHTNKSAQVLPYTPENIPWAGLHSSPAFVPASYRSKTRAQLRQLLIDRNLDSGSIKDNKSKLQQRLRENDLSKRIVTEVHSKGSEAQGIQFLGELGSKRILVAATTASTKFGVAQASVDAKAPHIQPEENEKLTKPSLTSSSRISRGLVKLSGAGGIAENSNSIVELEHGSTARSFANKDEPGVDKPAYDSSQSSSLLSELSDRDFDQSCLAATQLVPMQTSYSPQTRTAVPSQAIPRIRFGHKIKRKVSKRSRSKVKDKGFKPGEDSSSSEGATKRKKGRMSSTGKAKSCLSSATEQHTGLGNSSSNQRTEQQAEDIMDLVRSEAVEHFEISVADTSTVRVGERESSKPIGDRTAAITNERGILLPSLKGGSVGANNVGNTSHRVSSLKHDSI
ncbi:hypothetical protein AOQ84DRAFT_224937 [Glonium stellatum]|uniref:Uncharacterized protein n=1 Tax=Glonium stellatum TaxID=574774 RepID=A0A8E2JQ73_9PEZI|nr:hypothetical protein AOQ84DRAFT_224937 [Glonium stellatum]